MSFWSQHRSTIALVAPLLSFFVLASLFSHWYPYQTADASGQPAIQPSAYLALVASRVFVIGAILSFFAPIYLKTFPFRIDGWGVLLGIIGGAIWILLCHLAIEEKLVSAFGLPEDILGKRDAVDPFLLYPSTGSLWTFLFLRFALLVVIVPVAEELFLRGFLMRAMDAQDWQTLPLTEIGRAGLVMGTVYGVAAHPGEAVAAAIWFSMITALMVRTGKFWNCVLAHALTNLILGIYVCQTSNWQWW